MWSAIGTALTVSARVGGRDRAVTRASAVGGGVTEVEYGSGGESMAVEERWWWSDGAMVAE